MFEDAISLVIISLFSLGVLLQVYWYEITAYLGLVGPSIRQYVDLTFLKPFFSVAY